MAVKFIRLMKSITTRCGGNGALNYLHLDSIPVYLYLHVRVANYVIPEMWLNRSLVERKLKLMSIGMNTGPYKVQEERLLAGKINLPAVSLIPTTSYNIFFPNYDDTAKKLTMGSRFSTIFALSVTWRRLDFVEEWRRGRFDFEILVSGEIFRLW